MLFLDGEELAGAKQNRILNASLLVGAKSNIKIPVSCAPRGPMALRFNDRAGHLTFWRVVEKYRAHRGEEVRASARTLQDAPVRMSLVVAG
ncbi:MAG: hypothetical protein HUU20_21595 [Pirellulales bacterium]|nr:hypothetical protein [Pirellulales bacterium]